MIIKPTGHHLLIELEQVDEKFSQNSKLIMPEKTKDREQAGAQYARILAMGPEAYADRDRPWCQVGDRVIMKRYPGAQFDYDGDRIRQRIVNDDEVIAVVEED